MPETFIPDSSNTDDNWPFDRLQEKERDSVLMEIERDRVRQERDQALDDLQNVERSFRDIQR